MNSPHKSLSIEIFLCIFFGWLGFNNFYSGKKRYAYAKIAILIIAILLFFVAYASSFDQNIASKPEIVQARVNAGWMVFYHTVVLSEVWALGELIFLIKQKIKYKK